jgi:hypothetical protein
MWTLHELVIWWWTWWKTGGILTTPCKRWLDLRCMHPTKHTSLASVHSNLEYMQSTKHYWLTTFRQPNTAGCMVGKKNTAGCMPKIWLWAAWLAGASHAGQPNRPPNCRTKRTRSWPSTNSPFHRRGFRRGRDHHRSPHLSHPKPKRFPRRRAARRHGVPARHPPRRQHHLRPLRSPRIRKPASISSSPSPPLLVVPRTLGERLCAPAIAMP